MPAIHRTVCALAAALVFAAASTPAAAQSRNLMNFADRNGDDRVTLEEYEAFSIMAWNRATDGAERVMPDELDERTRARYEQISLDEDGYLTRKNFRKTIPARFARLDGNGDGELDEAEINSRNR